MNIYRSWRTGTMISYSWLHYQALAECLEQNRNSINIEYGLTDECTNKCYRII